MRKNRTVRRNQFGIAASPSRASGNDSRVFLAVAEALERRLFLSTVSFLSPTSSPAGSAPRVPALADLNGDGKLDLIVPNSGAGTVSVLLGNGDGTFQTQQVLTAGSDPYFVTAADLTGDGKPDIVVVNRGSDDVGVFLNNGNGTFPPEETFATGTSPTSVAVADLNKDGKPDLVVTNQGSGTVSILLGAGNGTFQPQRTYLAGSYPFYVAAGDLNGDGNPDLVVANATAGSSAVSVLLGNGDGTFKPPQAFAAGSYTAAVAIADLNGDGKPDVVALNAASGNISILLGNGDGTLQPQQTIAVGTSPSGLIVGDFTGDGKLDLAVARRYTGDVDVLAGNGDGTFQPPQVFAAGSSPVYLAAGDLNQDGKLDLVATDLSSVSVSVLLNATPGTSGGTFAVQPPLQAGNAALAVAVGDFNDDGKPDLAVANSSSSDVSIFLGNGDGTFQPQTILDTDSFPADIAVGDFNGDGNLDLAVANSDSGTVSILLGNGDGTFAPQTTVPVGMGPESLVAGDFNGDGKLDLAVVNYGAVGSDSTVSILLGNGDGTFAVQTPITVGEGQGNEADRIVEGDFTGDGKLDLAVANPASSTVSILLGNGDGTFAPPTNLTVTGADSLAVGDFNGDGKLDLAVGSSNAVSIFLGNGDGTFAPAATVPADGRLLAAGDFNLDGKLDLAAGSGESLSILLGNGDGTFAAQPGIAAGIAAYDIVAADLNGDSKPDLALANEGGEDGTVSVLLNLPSAGSTPSITSNNSATFTAGSNDNFTIMTSGTPTPAITETGALPSGVTFTDNGDGTAALHGDPAASSLGTYTLTLKAANAFDSATQVFTLTVSPRVVYVDPSASGQDNGQDWADAFTTLSAAVDSSQVIGGTAVQIDVAAGTYVPISQDNYTFTLPEIANLMLIGGFAPGGSPTPNPSQNISTLSGGGVANNIVSDDATIAALSGFTISGGNADLGSFPQNSGGGVNVIAAGGTLSISNCIFTNNQATNAGGAIYVTGSTSSLTVTDSQFMGNQASGSNTSGGAVYTQAASSTFTGCTFTGNSADFGGAIDAQSQVAGNLSLLTLIACTFTGNTATNNAGAVESAYGNVLEATNCIFMGNTANSAAGAVSLFQAGGNYQAGQGLINCVFTGNIVADNSASAVGISSASPSIINCTISGNVSGGGSAIADTNGSVSTIINCIVYGDGSTEISNDATSSAAVSYSDVQGGFGGTANINADPLFVSFPSNLQLAADSPAINTGMTAALPAGVTTDAAGNPRVVGPAVDMGAYEFQSAVAPQFISAAGAAFTNGAAGTFMITAGGLPAPTLTESGALPPGVSFLNNGNGTATLSGTPTTSSGGNYVLTLTASNGILPNATQTFTLTVDSMPAITSASSAMFVTNRSGTFTITTSGVPNPALSEIGSLPAGVTFTDNGNGTATLAGTASVLTTTSFPLTIQASNGIGGAVTQSFTLTVQAPVITMSGGMVSAAGTDGDDTAAVTFSGGNLVLTIDGMTQSFAMTSAGAIMINLGAGNDSIRVGSNVPAISLNGGSGNDTLMANNSAADSVAGGSGADLIMGGGPGSLLTGNGGNDNIVPMNSNETIKGNGGNDTISSVGGSNMLLGGAGDDLFIDFGASSPNTIDGGPGLNFSQYNPKDQMANIYQLFSPPKGTVPSVATPSAVPLDTPGSITESVSDGVLKIVGDAGNDTISLVSNGVKIIITANGTALPKVPLASLIGVSVKGKGGDDVITIDPSITLPATLNGNGGNDSLTGGGGDNVIISGAGNDTLVGGAGMNLLVPGSFETYSDTSPGNDVLEGGAGYSIADFSYRLDGLRLSNDGKADSGDPLLGETMTIGTDISAIWGGTGNDTIIGAHGGEFLSGGHGADSITGGGAGDLLVGGKNKDTVAVAAEPVTLYLRDNVADDYSGVNDPNEDILVLDAGLDQMI